MLHLYFCVGFLFVLDLLGLFFCITSLVLCCAFVLPSMSLHNINRRCGGYVLGWGFIRLCCVCLLLFWVLCYLSLCVV